MTSAADCWYKNTTSVTPSQWAILPPASTSWKQRAAFGKWWRIREWRVENWERMKENLIYNLIQQQNYLSRGDVRRLLLTSLPHWIGIMRLVYALSPRATEVVLFRKLGVNEVWFPLRTSFVHTFEQRKNGTRNTEERDTQWLFVPFTILTNRLFGLTQ